MKIFLHKVPFSNNSVKAILSFLVILSFLGINNQTTTAQIYEPEGLNMPGFNNDWTIPPSNPAFASATLGGGLISCTSEHKHVCPTHKQLKSPLLY